MLQEMKCKCLNYTGSVNGFDEILRVVIAVKICSKHLSQLF